MGKVIDLTGQVFGRLTVVRRVENSSYGAARWETYCECGKTVIAHAHNLRRGLSCSCGCQRTELHTKHGMYLTPEYKAWCSLTQRCGNPNDKRYANYGGRGISVSEDWLVFENFYRDIGPRPSPKHSLDRKDNNGNYCKENCRWATRKEQNNNKRTCRVVEFDGRVMTIRQWAEHLGIGDSALRCRLSRGWPIERALTEKVK